MLDTRRPLASETMDHPISVFTNMCSSPINICSFSFNQRALQGIHSAETLAKTVVFERGIPCVSDPAVLARSTYIHPDDGWPQYRSYLSNATTAAGCAV